MALRVLLDGLTFSGKVYSEGDIIDKPADYLLELASGARKHPSGQVVETVDPVEGEHTPRSRRATRRVTEPHVEPPRADIDVPEGPFAASDPTPEPEPKAEADEREDSSNA